MSTKLLTPSDLADRFGESERKVLDWNRIYNWPCVKVGRTFRWTEEHWAEIVRRHADQPRGEDRPSVLVAGQTARSASRRRSA